MSAGEGGETDWLFAPPEALPAPSEDPTPTGTGRSPSGGSEATRRALAALASSLGLQVVPKEPGSPSAAETAPIRTLHVVVAGDRCPRIPGIAEPERWGPYWPGQLLELEVDRDRNGIRPADWRIDLQPVADWDAARLLSRRVQTRVFGRVLYPDPPFKGN